MAALVIAALTPATATGAPVRVKELKAISGASPFPAGCGVDVEGDGFGDGFEDAEAEPQVAVNAADRKNIVAAWMQDLYQGLVTAASNDGGRTWTTATVPGTSTCSGGDHDLTADPWVSIGPDGRAYASGFSLDLLDPGIPAPFRTRLYVSTSKGGTAWSDPVELAGGLVADHDKPAITADPGTPGAAYVAWSDQPSALTLGAFNTFFSRTLDGGRTWSPPLLVFVPPRPAHVSFNPEVLVLPDGALLLMATLIPATAAPPSALPYAIVTLRSEDRGRTWSRPVTVAEFASGGSPAAPFNDPETGEPIQAPETNPAADVAPDGTAYIAWPHATSAEADEIRIARSRDGGRTWSKASVVSGVPAQMFLPTVAVAGNGTVGATYYDVRNDVLGDGPYSADVWFAHSHDRGRTWRERRLAGPFDLRRAPYRRIPVEGRFLGDYHGLAGRPAGFGAAFALAKPLAKTGPATCSLPAFGSGRGDDERLTVLPSGLAVGHHRRRLRRDAHGRCLRDGSDWVGVARPRSATKGALMTIRLGPFDA